METTPAFTAGALCLPVKLSAFARSGGTGGSTKGRNGFVPASTGNAATAANDSTTTRPNAHRSDAERPSSLIGARTPMHSNTPTTPQAESARADSVQRLVMPLELALTRWSVVHRQWHEIGGDCPLLTAFLAGWCCRSIGASMPEDLGMFRDSFRVGWREAEDMMTIEARRHNARGSGDGEYKTL